MNGRVFLIVGLLALVACGGSPADGPAKADKPSREGSDTKPGSAAVGVMAHRVRQEPISTYILANTTLEPIREVTTYSKLNAIVEKISVEEGDAVNRDQELLQLEDREIRNEHLQARIAVDQARLSLEQAKVRAQQMEAGYQRALSLFEEQLTSQQEFDQAVLDNRTEKLAVQNAEQQYQGAQARLEAAEIQLSHTRIRSPIAGVITSRLVNAGDQVNVNQAVFKVADLSVLWARLYVPEKALPQIRPGQRARIEVETYPDYQAQGVVKMISPGIDPTSGTFKVTLEVREEGRLLRPGMFGTVRMATETHPQALVIPKKAVLRDRDQDRIFVIQADQTVQKRAVTLGYSERDRVEVISGVALGETVVTVGHEGLSDGYPVRVVGWEAADKAAAGSEQLPVSAQFDADTPVSGPHGGEPQPPLPPTSLDRLELLEKRLLDDPAIRREYQARLVKDPDLSTDIEKKKAFLREIMQRSPGRPSSQ